MGIFELINKIAVAEVLSQPISVVKTGGQRRFTNHDHFTPKEWVQRKKRNKMQRKSRKINRQRAK